MPKYPKLILLLGVLLAGPAAAQSGTGQGAVRWLSPMGEPISGEEGLGDWLRAADTDGDGEISSAEFIADARRFFQTLDVDGDGEIGADEMRRYETELLQPARGEYWRGPGKTMPPGGGVTGRPRKSQIRQTEQPQPVASADLDMNRRVSKAEFDKTAMRRFQRLDADQSRKLSELELRKPRD